MLQNDSYTAPDIEIQLGEYLGSAAVVANDDLERGKAAAAATGKRLDQALVELGLMTESSLLGLLPSRFGVVELEPLHSPDEPVATEALGPGYLALVRAIPIDLAADTITLAMCDPFDDFTARAIALKMRRPVLRRRMSYAAFVTLFSTLYGEGYLAPAEALNDRAGPENAGDAEVLRDAASDAPVVRFVHRMIRQAVDRGASDIHLRPAGNRAEVLLRVDGRLVSQETLDGKMLASVLSRLKILAGLDISERRLPQDGKIRANVAGDPIDIRLATMPHSHGEAAVLRILARHAASSSLAELGFSPSMESGLARLFDGTEGLILVTGPTGSGKTTTLHAGLRRLVRPDLNVVTIEDPIEYRLEGAAQIQVDDKIGLTFPRVLRSLLRQDPDIILVGEIRDAETAKIAVQAALTGHLVLATLHTNSAMAAVARLIDMEVEAYLLAAVLRGALAQRLVRKLCDECAIDAGDHTRARRCGPGCEKCGHSGHVGRIAVGELILTDSEVTEALSRNTQLPEKLLLRLRENGYRPLAEDAQARAQAGEIDAADLRGVLHG